MQKKKPIEPVILITGAARRIGAVIARLFHGKGYRIIIHFNQSAAEADRICKSLNNLRSDSCFLVQSDLNKPEDIDKIVDLIETIGRLDILINNASSFYPTPLKDCNEEKWEDLFSSNLKGPFFLAQRLAEMLIIARGSIINISDMHARQALDKHPIYTIAKAGNISMTKTLAKELAPNVRVNSVAPGAILWPEHESDDLDKQNSVLSKVPVGRLGTENDIADAVFFLAVKATYVTGQTIAVDGGSSNSL